MKTPRLLIIIVIIGIVSCNTKYKVYDKIESYMNEEDYNSAIQLIDSLVTIDSMDARLYFLKGEIFIDNMNYCSGVSYLEKALEKGMFTSGLFVDLGHAEYMCGDTFGALNSFLAANRLDSTAEKLNYNFGIWYYNNYSYKLAIDYFKKEIEYYPDNIHAIDALASSYYHSGLFDNCIKEYMQISDSLMDISSYYELAESYIFLDKFDKALEIYIQAKNKFPFNPWLQINLSKTYGLMGNHDSALIEISKISHDTTYRKEFYNIKYLAFKGLNIFDSAQYYKNKLLIYSD